VSEGYFNAYTAPNSTCNSSLCLQTTDSNVAIYNVNSTNNVMCYVSEACIASSKLSCQSLNDSSNSALNIKTVMDYDTRSWVFCKDNAVILSILSGGTARYGVATTAACITNDADLANKIYVDEAVDGIGVSNGICESGDNFVLGGTLTGDTQIDASTNDFCLNNAGAITIESTGAGAATIICGYNSRFCGTNSVIYGSPQLDVCFSNFGRINDTSGSPKGLVNAGDYENNFVARSLVTKQYVSGVTSGITGAITSANNGLTKDGQNVRLGGTLTGNTTIAGASNVMTFNGLNGFNVTSVSATTCGTTSLLLRSPSISVHDGTNEVINITSACNILKDSTNNEGFVYAANYCTVGKTNPRWIPDNAYITGLTSGLITGATNGLTPDSQNIKLGGTLTETTDICMGGGASQQTFKIQGSGTTTCSVFDMNGTTVGICASNVNSPFQTGRVTVGSSGTVVCSGFGGCFSSVNMANSMLNICANGGTNNAYLRVTDDTSTPRGLEYAACYHATYCDRSLVDKEYVVSQVSGITANAITGATNGLCKFGQNVVLGGDLTGVTTICSCGNNLDIVGKDANSVFRYLDSAGVRSGWEIENCVGDYETTATFQTCESSGFASSIIEACNTADNCKAVLRIQDFGAKLMYFSGTTSASLILDGTSSRFCDTYREQGLIYGGDYEANFVPRSLVTAQYVSGVTSGITGAFTSANNGICANGQTISLGGALTGNTEISGGTHALCVTFSNDDSCLKIDDNDSRFQVGCITDSFGQLSIADNIVGLNSSSGASNATFNLQHCANNGGGKLSFGADFVIRSCMCSTGFYYVSDYSSGLSPRWIPDAAWVTGQTTTTGIQTAVNGLCKIGTEVSLGGSLTGDTTIDAGTNLFEVCGEHDSGIAVNSVGGSRTASMYAGSGNTTSGLALSTPTGGFTTFSQLISSHVGGECATFCSVAAASGTESSWRVCDGSAANEIKLEASGEMTITDAIDSRGLVYGGDYETNFSPRSLVTCQFVSDCVNTLTGVTSNAITGATNGLTEVNNDVKLGGTLCETTVISGGSQILRLGDSSSLLQNLYADVSNAVQVQSSSIYLNAGSGGANYKGGNFCVLLDNTNAVFCDNSTGKDGLKYAACISTGFTNSCSLVDKGYVDNASNTVAVCNVTSNYTATTINDFIGVSGATEIYLPAAPKQNQRIIVADICGNALAANITIYGNGLCINGNGGATINTDYGAMTFINNGYSWSAVAFIN